MNATPHAEGSLKSFYGYKETFAKETTWVQVPRELKFVHTNNPFEDDLDGGYADGDTSFMTEMSEAYGDGHVRDPYEQELERALRQEAYPQYATQGLEALSAVASQDQYSYAHVPPPAPMTQPEHSPHQHFSTAHPQQGNSTASQNLDYILNPTSAAAAMSHSNNSNIDPRLHSEHPMPPREDSGQGHHQVPEHVRIPSTSLYGQPRSHRSGSHHSHACAGAIESPELAFLLGDFSERGRLWMGLFDLTLFFATAVSVLAVECPLLLYSRAALSAKSLARVHGRKSTVGAQIEQGRQRSMER